LIRFWPALDVRPASELLQAALTDYDLVAIDERSEDNWRVFFASPAERDRAHAGLRVEFPDVRLEPVDVPDENWAARSQASLRAIRVGDIIVAPPWDVPAGAQRSNCPAADGEPDATVIVIHPSMGFGTGHHATTRLCLAALQRLDLRGRSVLDVGTGSGVLAIAARFLGATHVVGIDDDPDAVASARENLELNKVVDLTLVVGDLRSADLDPADVVVANLTGGLLASAAPRLQQLAAPGGRLILSGLMVQEDAQTLRAFAPWTVEHRAEEDGWISLTLTPELSWVGWRSPVETADPFA